jgi:hypothetical protein
MSNWLVVAYFALLIDISFAFDITSSIHPLNPYSLTMTTAVFQWHKNRSCPLLLPLNIDVRREPFGNDQLVRDTHDR